MRYRIILLEYLNNFPNELLIKYLYLFRYLDCPVSSQREEVNIRVQLIKIFLPYLFYCIDGGSEETKTFILRNLEAFISEILVIFEKNCVTESRVGFLLNLMDQVLEDETASDTELCNLVTEILRHGLRVSKICCAEDEDEISLGMGLHYRFSVTYHS